MLNDSFLYDKLMQSALQSQAQIAKEKKLRYEERMKNKQRRREN